MKRSVIVLLALLSAIPLVWPSVLAQGQPQEIPFDSVPDFLKPPPNVLLGENAGVAVNSKGHIFVYTRPGGQGHILAPRAAQLLEFGPDGKFVREVAPNLYSMAWAHAVRVDSQDNIWLVDNGSDMIVKLNPDGSRVLLTLGRRRESLGGLHPFREEAGAPTPPARDTVFNEPTDIAWDPQGNIFISDGYKNMSVAKLDKSGNWVKRIGKGNMAERGTGPGEFNNPHGIAADAKGNIYVADRGNARIQVFDSDLQFLREIKINVPTPSNIPWTYYPPGKGTFESGSPWALCVTPGPNQVLYAADAYPGRLYKLSLDGKVLGYLGRNGKELKQFNWIHAIACPSENELVVAELLSWRVQKLNLKPGKSASSNP